jgi:hypothetical protein
MKILCLWANSAPHFIRSGWGRAFSYCGHEFHFWNKDVTSAFDVFNAIEPDIFIGTTYDLDRATIKNIVQRPDMKVALFSSAWGEFVEHVPKQFPIVRVTDEEKKNLDFLKKYVNKPDFVFLHLTKNWTDPIIGGFKQLGIKPVGILNAADTLVYLDGKSRREYECDVSIVSGYWPYKAVNLDKYFGPLNKFPLDIKLKIFGNGAWNHLYYLGRIEEKDTKDLFSSSKICPNISEPHSYMYNDLTERSFKVICAGGFCIHDNAVGIEEVYHKNEVPRFSNYDEFISLIDKFIKNPLSRGGYKSRAFNKVMSQHTYFHRIHQMFVEFGLNSEAYNVQMNYTKFLTEKGIDVQPTF